MKTPFRILWITVLCVVAGPAFGADRAAEWAKVDEAIKLGQPKTGIELLEPIIQAALAEDAHAEAARAIAQRIVLEGSIQGSKPEEVIVRLEQEIQGAPEEIVPILTAVLASHYWQYFSHNRWRFMNRTATAEPPGDDITTWDLQRLFAAIDRVFQQALARPAWLQGIPIADYDRFLVKGNMPDIYRPTLYDFIAQEALEFYTSAEQAGARPRDAFEIAASDPMLSDAALFLAWEPVTADTNSNLLRAIGLYQDILRFHVEDDDRSAYLDADLARLIHGFNVAVGGEKTARFEGVLKAFVEANAGHEVSALALHRLALMRQERGELVEARDLAIRGANAHPDSPGGRRCINLVRDIEQPDSQLGTEQVWNAPWPDIRIRYRNLTNVWLRAVRADWTRFLDKDQTYPEALNQAEREALIAASPVLEWTVPLADTTNYQHRTESLPMPEELPQGFYYLIASHNAAFSDNHNVVSYTDFWVSDLALVIRPRADVLEGFVLNALSGEPVAEATVDVWAIDQPARTRQPLPSVESDAEGFFHTVPSADRNRGYIFRVTNGGDTLGSSFGIRHYPRRDPDPRSMTIFFTDRSLYRPGQTIEYKGICLRVDTVGNNYEVLAGQSVEVVFTDRNNKEIARQTRRANDYGSISGSFTAPRDRLMGRMSIAVPDGPKGNVSINVEEYKRPKFRVTLDPPETAPKLDEVVRLTGKAESYTGAAVDGAKVVYRVVRQVRMPYWYGWFRGAWHGGANQEMDHGTLETSEDGSFTIEFTARPDLSISPADEPVFRYSVHADVTDPNGETRSDEHVVSVGYTALQATLTAQDWQTVDKPVAVGIRTATLDGVPQVASGRLVVHTVRQPEGVRRPALLPGLMASDEEEADATDPNRWPLGEAVAEAEWTTDAEGKAESAFSLPAGLYRAVLETKDRFGKAVTAMQPLRVLDPKADHLNVRLPHVVVIADGVLEPGEEMLALWGTGYETGRALVEIEHRNIILQRFWTKPGTTQQAIRHAVTEAMRGGFTLHVTQVRENRAYLTSHHITVPWSNKALDISWEHFVSKLEPGRKETWTAVLRKKGMGDDKPAEALVAEMVAALYDESLDQFMRHTWRQQFGVFHSDVTSARPIFQNSGSYLRLMHGRWPHSRLDAGIRYRYYPPELAMPRFRFDGDRGRRFYRSPMQLGGRFTMDANGLGMSESILSATPAAGVAFGSEALAGENPAREEKAGRGGGADGEGEAGRGPDLEQVTARKNLDETAFFFPQLISDENGVVRLEFTMPEALTQWRFLGFAHDKELRSGFIEDHVVTSKDLMIQPNPPRFLREGDELEFTVKVVNLSAAGQQGNVRLSLNHAWNNRSADSELGNTRNELPFDVPAKESRTYSWRLKVPDGMGFLTYKAVGATTRLSDGEEGYLPVLSRRIFLTESLPLPVRGPGEKAFEFDKLLASRGSKTLSHHALTVRMVSNPSWYAVMALPYLMEFPHACNEQVFNRYYANSLAQFIGNSDPKIRRVFDQWKGTPALDSPLQNNEDLKSVLLEETPWLRQAESESEARRNLGILFDENRLASELDQALTRLKEAQYADGAWPWFPGGDANDYITLYITSGFGRLRHLGVPTDISPAVRACPRLDGWMSDKHERILKSDHPEGYVPTSTDALYLYARSFLLKEQPVAGAHQKAVDFFLQRAREHWLKTRNRQTEAHLALALHRFGDPKIPALIMRSIHEYSVMDEELGMFWRDTESSWWWYRAPIETQALMIEAFDEITGDKEAVEACRVWLLKQKQTQNWKTTKATADAIYGLLLRGTDILASDELVEVALDGRAVEPARDVAPGNGGAAPVVEAGTGFYERRFVGAEIRPRMGRITVTKKGPGVSWGAVHWQYFEDVSNVTPHEGTPLKLVKTVHVRENTPRGPELVPVKGAVKVGDEMVVRLELRVDRDLEFVHLKDQRGSGTEPVNVLSRYRRQDGLGYYESTRDTATHFFMDYLSKGTYVFEYAVRVQHRGRYQTGLAEIQCMYAPEFNSHSGSRVLVVE